MSGHGHHDSGADPHSDHDDHADETTSDDFPADEPRSPGWLPLLGGALFLAGFFAFVAFTGSDEPAAPAPAATPLAVAAPVRKVPTPAARPALPRRPPGASPELPPGHPQLGQRPGQ